MTGNPIETLGVAAPLTYIVNVMIGIFLILFGVLMLLDRLNLIDLKMGDYILPIILIAIGGSMLMNKKSKRTPTAKSHPK